MGQPFLSMQYAYFQREKKNADYIIKTTFEKEESLILFAVPLDRFHIF